MTDNGKTKPGSILAFKEGICDLWLLPAPCNWWGKFQSFRSTPGQPVYVNARHLAKEIFIETLLENLIVGGVYFFLSSSSPTFSKKINRFFPAGATERDREYKEKV